DDGPMWTDRPDRAGKETSRRDRSALFRGSERLAELLVDRRHPLALQRLDFRLDPGHGLGGIEDFQGRLGDVELTRVKADDPAARLLERPGVRVVGRRLQAGDVTLAQPLGG